ncbi:MAG: response regulator [Actinomycetota bacterium]|nr:response regulator [Actinomycetota bacterium]
MGTTVAPNAPLASRTAPRVVVVDDRHDRRQVMSHMITSSGSDIGVVGFAEDPASAVDAIERLHATAAIIEIQLPVEVGLKTVAALRGRYPDLRIIVCTFHQDHATRTAALATGADAYLGKPLSRRELFAALAPTP